MVSTHAWFRFTLKFTFIVQLSVLHSLASPAEWLPMFPKLRYFSYTAGMLQCWAPPLSRTMTSLKRSQTERSVGGSVPATDEFYTRRLRLPNGGAPPPRSESTHLTGTPGVPKWASEHGSPTGPPGKMVAVEEVEEVVEMEVGCGTSQWRRIPLPPPQEVPRATCQASSVTWSALRTHPCCGTFTTLWRTRCIAKAKTIASSHPMAILGRPGRVCGVYGSAATVTSP